MWLRIIKDNKAVLLDIILASYIEIKIINKGVDMNLRVILEPSEDGGFTVTVPSLPGCISEGERRVTRPLLALVRQ